MEVGRDDTSLKTRHLIPSEDNLMVLFSGTTSLSVDFHLHFSSLLLSLFESGTQINHTQPLTVQEKATNWLRRNSFSGEKDLFRVTVSRTESFAREATLCLKVVNSLRSQVPNFAYTYLHIEGPPSYLVTETVRDSVTLRQWLTVGSSEELLKVILQLQNALQICDKVDLRLGNFNLDTILVRQFPKPVTLPVLDGFVATIWVPYFTDFSAAFLGTGENEFPALLSEVENVLGRALPERSTSILSAEEPTPLYLGLSTSEFTQQVLSKKTRIRNAVDFLTAVENIISSDLDRQEKQSAYDDLGLQFNALSFVEMKRKEVEDSVSLEHLSNLEKQLTSNPSSVQFVAFYTDLANRYYEAALFVKSARNASQILTTGNPDFQGVEIRLQEYKRLIDKCQKYINSLFTDERAKKTKQAARKLDLIKYV